jgi:hypothetical protein
MHQRRVLSDRDAGEERIWVAPQGAALDRDAGEERIWVAPHGAAQMRDASLKLALAETTLRR